MSVPLSTLPQRKGRRYSRERVADPPLPTRGIRKTLASVFKATTVSTVTGSKSEISPARRGGHRAEAAGDFLHPSLSHVLADETLRNRFAAFLQKEFSHENLAFHQSASAFLEANGATRERRRGECTATTVARKTEWEEAENVEASLLIHHFVKQGAPEEINLPAGIRQSLVEAVRTSDEAELVRQMDAARLEVFKLMERDSFSRFVLTLSSDAQELQPGAM